MWLDDLGPTEDRAAQLAGDSVVFRPQIDAVLAYRSGFPEEIQARIDLHRADEQIEDNRFGRSLRTDRRRARATPPTSMASLDQALRLHFALWRRGVARRPVASLRRGPRAWSATPSRAKNASSIVSAL